MKNVLADIKAAVKEVLKATSALQKETVAAAVAGVVVPIIAKVFGADVTVAETTVWLVLMGGVAATLESLNTVKSKKS